MYQQVLPYLPDNVIEKILSFLPIKDAARATTVSKQWSSLWPCFLAIDLDEGDPLDMSQVRHWIRHRRFQRFLFYSLTRCWDQKLLDKLRIRAKCDIGFDERLVRRWVDFAVQRCVKELDIRILCTPGYYIVPRNVLTLQSLVSLSLENVRMDAIHGPVSLPSLTTMSLTNVCFIDDQADPAVWTIPSLVSGCPRLEHLSIHRGLLGYNSHQLEISSDSLKSLEIKNCCSKRVEVTAKSLESFTFDTDSCTCNYHGSVRLWECDSLKYVDISCKGLKHLVMHNCLQTMENSFCTPNLESFIFDGNLNTKVHFVEVPSNLVKTTLCLRAPWKLEIFLKV